MTRSLLMSFILIGIMFSEQISKFKIDGMMCVSGCVWKVNNLTQSIEGVKKSEVDFEKGILTVEYDPAQVNDQMIIKRLSEQTTYQIKEFKEFSKKNPLEWFKNLF